jgi:hypothetical protein
MAPARAEGSWAVVGPHLEAPHYRHACTSWPPRDWGYLELQRARAPEFSLQVRRRGGLVKHFASQMTLPATRLRSARRPMCSPQYMYALTPAFTASPRS